MELGVSAQGSLDELRKRLKEKWRALEVYLPPHLTDKLASSRDTADTSGVRSLGGDSSPQTSYTLSKLRRIVVLDLVKGIPHLTDTGPEQVFRFLCESKGGL